jgi:NAD(P)H-dependent FMN reductase
LALVVKRPFYVNHHNKAPGGFIMLVLGIIGSPRKNGKTAALMQAALGGASAAGADISSLFLVDYTIKPLTDVGADAGLFCPAEVTALCEKADAYIIGAPVYYGDINGLTKDFMDSVGLDTANGKPALGYAVAGGSGKGLFSGVQSIYHWFYHRQLRGVDPTPVSRFNLEQVKTSLSISAGKLVNMAANRQPFPGEGREDRWAHVLEHYATLPYLNCDPVDEFIMLARFLIAGSKEESPGCKKAQTSLDCALDLVARGRRSEAAPHVVRAYELLYYSE